MSETLIRRRDDQLLVKIAKIWPIIVTLCGVVAAWAVTSRQVGDNTKRLDIHEGRLTNVEVNAAVARINTDALVQRFLTPAEQRTLQSQVDAVSTYVLESKSKEGGKPK